MNFNLANFFIIFITIFFSINFSYAKYTVETKTEKLISNFLIKLDKKNNIDKEKIILENINSKITYYLENKKLDSKKEKLLNDILVLFNEKIFDIDYKSSLENNSQIFIEAKIISELKNKLDKISAPNYIKNIGKKYYKISENFEFVENNLIKKIDFTKYYLVKSSNINQFKNKNGIFAINNIGKIFFIENYKIVNKIKYSQSKNIFAGYINYKTKFLKKDDIFYSYNFKDYKLFDDKYGFYIQSLTQNNIDPSKSVLYYSKNKKYNFITNFQKTRLIKSDIIYGIVDKKDFLNDLVDDKLYLYENTDNLFIDLKNKIYKLTQNKKKDEKIKLIYDFILKNVEYTQNLNLKDKKIFSGILTYKNKNGICEGYTKLASYSLKFAGIKDARIIRGDVIDAPDFPRIGHAWLKIGSLYYDPTFDDPIGSTSTKKFNEYRYFGLPKDLLYANRFDYGTTPEGLKTKNLNERKILVYKNLSKLADKYKTNNYLILKGVKFNKKNNIEVGKNITLNNLKSIIPYYEVEEKNSGELVFYEKSKKKNITKLQFYTIDKENINDLVEQLNYNLDGYYLFKWNKSGKIDYRLGFNVVIK